MKLFKIKNTKLVVFSAVTSLFILLAYHFPFYSYVTSKGNFIIVASLALIMLVTNFFVTYLLLWMGRIVGKTLLAISFILNAASLYFINTFDVMLDDSMMGNVFNTNYSEASSFSSSGLYIYIFLLGILPSILIFLVKIDYGPFKRCMAYVGSSLLLLIILAFGNMSNWPWVDKNSTVMGSLILPWSYTVNSIRYQQEQNERNREEIRLPDAKIIDNQKSVLVLVIGESARRDHFSLYGYKRETNPLLSKVSNLTIYNAKSTATYTTAAVKSILDYKETDDLYEILPNYLYRNGAEVIWRTSNWGEPPLHIDKVQTDEDLWKEANANNPKAKDTKRYDEILLKDLKTLIEQSPKEKVLIVLHTYTNHGPIYSNMYPKQFEVFKPVCHSAEMSSYPKDQLINGYDNSVIYVDYLLNKVITTLQELPEWKSCMLFLSDHGESLGENNLYMHGVPMSIAPKEQYEVPFIVWTSDENQRLKQHDLLSPYYVFHSVMHFLGFTSPIYNPSLNLFEEN